MLLAQLCAENELVKVRLVRQMPSVGESPVACEQAGQLFTVQANVQPTPNVNFLRVDAKVFREDVFVLTLSTIVGRY